MISILLISVMAILFLGCKKVEKSKVADVLDTQIQADTVCWLPGEIKSSKVLVEDFIFNPTKYYKNGAVLINTQQELIAIAEPILFSVFGKASIVDARPYIICLVGDYWTLEGTIHENQRGGYYCIAINRRTCEVVGINYGK